MEFDLALGITILRRTPPTLEALLDGLSEDWTHQNEGPNTWSPFDVVGHLIDGEETDWMSRVHIILEEGPDTPFQPFDRVRHIRLNQGKSLRELLGRFAELRAGNLDELEGLALSPTELQLKGRHPEFGPVSLAQLLATWVAHDLDHLAQIARVMAKQYHEAVGPWHAYLSVLTR